MKPYTAYKQINLPWLKSIPDHWEIWRNKNIFTELKEEVGDEVDSHRLLSLTLNGIIPRDVNAGGKFPSSFEKYKIVKTGNMAFCLFDIDETPRTVGLSQYDGMLTGAYTIMRVDNINSKYAYYYYLALDNGKKLKPLYKGLRKTIDITTFQSAKLPVPPRAEQEQIVRFLDWKVSLTNKLINIRTNEISKLEELKRSKILNCVMGQENDVRSKLSSISWVKNIPYNWNEEMLIQVAEEQKIKNVGFAETNLLSLSYGKIIEKDINTTEGLLPASFEGYQIVYPGNIILRLTDLQNDRKSLRTGISTTKGIITSAYTCLKVRDNIFPEYLHLQLHSADLCKVFYGMGGGVRQSIGFKEIRNLIIAIPPIEEQRRLLEVAKLIDNQSNLLMEKYKEQISALNDLKQRLISDVVTGQIDVRNIKIPEYEYVEEKSDSDSDDIDGDFDSEEISEEA
ncbi:MAG: restriction endonuclease subunit S [Saccharofermentanales bacterium]|jgi:type I restriction enzyme S subunit